MPVIPIDTPDDPRLADFSAVPDPTLLRERHQFVAEGRFAIETLLRARRFSVRALLLTQSTHRALAGELAAAQTADIDVYVASAAHFKIGGYDFHRGYLALADRPDAITPSALIAEAAPGRPLLALERIGNPDNIGGIFRNAAAFGAAGVLLSPGCGDPFYRKAVRTSIGATLRVPFATSAEWPGDVRRLRAGGYTIVALTPEPQATALSDVVESGCLRAPVALLLGAEGDGLSAGAVAEADLRVRITIDPSVDSLNVATASGIALHHLAVGR